MPPQVGLRVVRGPDWKWGDQDGGVGHAGTVIPSSHSDVNHLGPRTVTVLWDCGKVSVYKGGPNGSHHLRVVDNTSMGVKHTGIPCGDDSCWVQEILGTRWQCTTCEINLCTHCFLKKVPHNLEHVQFKRFTTNEGDKKPSIVRCWGADGPDSRIELKGFYPGATVSMGPKWPYQKEGERKSGLVVTAPKEEVYGRILVEWQPSRERTRHQRSDSDGNLELKLKEPGFGGFYYPEAFTAMDTDVHEVDPRPSFSFGDRVHIDPSLKTDDFRRKQMDHGGYADWLKDYVGAIGTVQCMEQSSVNVRFKDCHGSGHVYWSFNPAILTKLNKFSVNQVIRIRNDERTIQSIDSKFMQLEIRQKLIGATGRVSEISNEDPSKLIVLFDDAGIYQWLSKREALPSSWMEHFESTDFACEKEIAEAIEKIVSVFMNAVGRGDLRAAKLLHLHHTIVADARNANGESALHVACTHGYKDIVEWLIDDVKVDLEKSSKIGHRPIHYAAYNCNPLVLGLLIDRGVDVDSQTTNSKCTALHIAAVHHHTECCRLLIDGGCDPNVQDVDGCTPLHHAIFNGNALCVHQILSRLWINFELRNSLGFNVFHLAVVMDDLKAVELMMRHENMDDPLLELMPDSKSTVLHYACIHKNYQMAKCLVNRSKAKIMPDGSFLLDSLLDVKNESNRTALLVACNLKNSPLIELLAEAGANCKALDKQGNNAILLAAISRAAEEDPTDDLSPSIFKVYQSITNDSDMKMMQNKTTLSLIAYLMIKGCPVDTRNKIGLKLSDILQMDNCYPEDILDILKRFQRKQDMKQPSCGSGGCMGRAGCSQQPVFQLFCTHGNGHIKVCSKCALLPAEDFKCGCPEEEFVAIPNAASSSIVEVPSVQMRINEEREEAEETEYVFEWVDDGTKNGKVTDRMGNIYLRSGTRMDGGIGYRCSAPSAVGRKERCTAVARRYIKDGSDYIYLESQHTKHDQGNPLMRLVRREQ